MSKGTIVVVDDSEVVRDAVSFALEDRGWEVVTTASPLQLPLILRKSPATLILMDVNMPTLSGDKAVDLMKQYAGMSKVPVLFHSDRPESELQDLVRRTGAFGFIRKTGDGDELSLQIDAWVARSRAGASRA